MLNILWFVILGVVLTAYAILDGFDLGVGILHPFTRKDEDRRVLLNSIGPVWDGNEVWLITFGGALFAAFPTAYATIFSTFYTPFMLLLCMLIFRAASIEFRSKLDAPAWRAVWDYVFALTSAVAALLFGVATGNSICGLAVNGDMIYEGSFFDFLNPFSLLTGLMTVALFAMHGALYLRLKTEDELRARAGVLFALSATLFLVFFLATAAYGLAYVPATRAHISSWFPAILALAFFNGAAISAYEDRPLRAFLSSAGLIGSLVLLFGMAMFPALLRSSINPAFTLNIFNAASSTKTLIIMLGIVLAALPLVLAYTAFVYYIFRGKVVLNKTSY
jgi:cytochrome bd ubiquinol oxidase subunit II